MWPERQRRGAARQRATLAIARATEHALVIRTSYAYHTVAVGIPRELKSNEQMSSAPWVVRGPSAFMAASPRRTVRQVSDDTKAMYAQGSPATTDGADMTGLFYEKLHSDACVKTVRVILFE